jgi:hypothetical protein
LQDDGFRAVVDAVLQWEINRVVFAFCSANITNFASPREEFSTVKIESQQTFNGGGVGNSGLKAIQDRENVLPVYLLFMKRYSHDPISCVEGLLDAISMMDINVDVKDSLVKPQKLQYGQYNICEALDHSRVS